jgi:hypothetical protein
MGWDGEGCVGLGGAGEVVWGRGSRGGGMWVVVGFWGGDVAGGGVLGVCWRGGGGWEEGGWDELEGGLRVGGSCRHDGLGSEFLVSVDARLQWPWAVLALSLIGRIHIETGSRGAAITRGIDVVGDSIFRWGIRCPS